MSNNRAIAETPVSLVAPDVQRAVLGSALLDSSLLRGPLADLAVTDFVGSSDQTIYGAMLELEEDGEPFDGITLIRLAEERCGGIENGGAAFIGELIDGAVPDPAVVKRHAETLQKLSQLRRLGRFGEIIACKAQELGSDPSVLLQKAENIIRSLRDGYDLDANLLPYAPRDLVRRPEILSLADVQPRDVDWIWRPYVPMSMLAMLSGDPGAGKTYLALAIAAALTVGQRPCNAEPCAPMDVLYLSVENSPEHVLRPRFDALRGDPSRFHVLRGSVAANGKCTDRKGVKLSDLPILEEALMRTKARLVIVDPIQSYLGAEVDAHRSNETRPVLDGLAHLAEKHQTCFFLIRHFAKSQVGRAIHRGLGSIDLTGAVRSELHAGEVDERRALVHAKSNLGQLGKSLGYMIEADGSFRWTGETDITASDLQAVEPNGEDRSAVEEAVGYLRDALASGARPGKEVQAELRDAGVSDATLRRAKSKLGVLSCKIQMRGGWEWYLPEGAQP